ncbi:MAG: flagellar basal body-associated FliL family protein [Desulfosarcinaceae bacterium]|nr:flagellar basal body-associated FliL family protein [Desulfosarcinaceae bacterium]
MSKTLIIIIAAFLLFVMALMGGGFFILWTKMSALSAPAPTTEEEVVEEEAPAEIGPLYSLGTLIVNLADEGGKRYLRVTIELELEAQDMTEEVEKRLPQVRDSILMILPTKTFADINTTPGKIALRDELLAAMNDIVTSGNINNLYFTEFVVQ